MEPSVCLYDLVPTQDQRNFKSGGNILPHLSSASEVMTVWRYRNLIIIIIIVY